jgi:molybdopterin-guanine dinucleotide biosynthesis protein A
VVGAEPDRFADLGLAAYPDTRPGLGAMGGLLTALERARDERVIVVACDLPFIDAGVLGALVHAAGRGDGAWVRTERGVEPLLACYNRSLHGRIEEAVAGGTRKLSDLGSVLNMVPLEGAALAAFGPPERLVTNVNSPEDHARVQYPSS